MPCNEMQGYRGGKKLQVGGRVHVFRRLQQKIQRVQVGFAATATTATLGVGPRRCYSFFASACWSASSRRSARSRVSTTED
jgi:hypothetical protein